jgi:hypothetical protein
MFIVTHPLTQGFHDMKELNSGRQFIKGSSSQALLSAKSTSTPVVDYSGALDSTRIVVHGRPNHRVPKLWLYPLRSETSVEPCPCRRGHTQARKWPLGVVGAFKTDLGFLPAATSSTTWQT